MFQGLRDWFERWWTLRELRSAEKNYSRAHSHIFSDQLELARGAFDRGARDQALEIWNKIRIRFPDLSITSEKGTDLLLDLGCYDEAEKLVREGRERYPGHIASIVGSARISHRRGDLDEAIRRCELVRRKVPNAVEGYTIAATCLANLDRQDDAEAMIGRGVSKLPSEADLHIRYADHAMRRCDWPEALKRWNVVRTQFNYSKGPLGMAQCLREMGRFDEAEGVLTECQARFETDDYVYVEWAKLAIARKDFDGAVQHWRGLIRKSPFFALAYTEVAEAMCRIGREAEADELLGAGVTRLPSSLAVCLAYARSASRREDWLAATERWALVRARFPESDEAREQEANALSASKRQGGRSDAK